MKYYTVENDNYEDIKYYDTHDVTYFGAYDLSEMAVLTGSILNYKDLKGSSKRLAKRTIESAVDRYVKEKTSVTFSDDEFVIPLELEQDIDNALKLAILIRCELRRFKLEEINGQLDCKISIGVGRMDVTQDPRNTKHEAYNYAMVGLYHIGYNSIVVESEWEELKVLTKDLIEQASLTISGWDQDECTIGRIALSFEVKDEVLLIEAAKDNYEAEKFTNMNIPTVMECINNYVNVYKNIKDAYKYK